MFKVPEINFSAKTVHELSDLSKAVSEPPITIDKSSEELKEFLAEPLHLGLPCSTVAVERAVKATTRAAKVSSDPLIQDGFTLLSNSAIQKNSVKDRDKKAWNMVS